MQRINRAWRPAWDHDYRLALEGLT